MYGSETGIGQGQSAQQACQCHPLPMDLPGSVQVGRQQASCGLHQTFPAETVGHGICPGRDISLQQLGQGVHSGSGGHCRRHGQGQFRIHHSQIRQHQRAAQADLDAFFRYADHRIAGDLRSGTCGGWDGDAGCGRVFEGFPLTDHFEIPEDLSRVGQKSRHRLGRVQHAAAAKTDHAFGVHFPGSLEGGGHRMEGRFPLHAIGDPQKVLFFQQVQQPSRPALGFSCQYQKSSCFGCLKNRCRLKGS